MDKVLEFFAVLSDGQKITLVLVVLAVILVAWRIAKTAIKLLTIAVICIIGFLAYDKLELSSVEKTARKAKYHINKAVE